MARTRNIDKDEVRLEFETMKSLELAAADQYARIAGDPSVEQSAVRTAFANMAEDERRHAELVEKIINLINNAL